MEAIVAWGHLILMRSLAGGKSGSHAAKPVKLTCDATIAFPLIVSQTLAKNVDEWKEAITRRRCAFVHADLKATI